MIISKRDKNMDINLIDVSEGNIPSIAANSIHVVKMAQAYSKLCNKFELITFGDIFHFLRIKKSNIRSFYSVDKFKISILPIYCNYSYPHDLIYRDKNYNRIVPHYCRFKKNYIFLTHSQPIALSLLKKGLKTALEWHMDLRVNYLKNKLFKQNNFLGFITISEVLSQQYISAGIPREKVFVQCNGADLGMFQKYSLNKEEARRKFSFPLDKKIVMYCGHLYDYKGIGLILDLAQKMSDALFVLVGGSPADRSRWESVSLGRNLKNVIFTGFVAQQMIPQYLGAADILILPSVGNDGESDYTSPLKLFDYMAARRPIVASKLKNIENVLVHNESGLLAEPDNPESFYANLKNLFINDEYAEKLAFNAYNRVQELSWNKRAEKILNFLKQQTECS